MADDDKNDDASKNDDKKDDSQEEDFDEERAKAKIAKVNSEAKGLRKRLADAEAKLAEHAQAEDAKKPEIERLTKQTGELERKAQEAEARALRLEVAAEKGLTPAQAKRLVGTTTEELEADADELLESFKPSDDKDGKPPPANRPKERLRGGNDPTEQVDDETDPIKLAASVPRL